MSQDFFYPPGSSNTVVIPPGGATSANQVTQIGIETGTETAVQSIDTKTPTQGQKTMALSSPVVIASDQSILPVHDAAFSNKTASAFINVPFDETVIAYVGATTNIASVTYKLATVTVNTLTLTYDGSNRLIDVVKT